MHSLKVVNKTVNEIVIVEPDSFTTVVVAGVSPFGAEVFVRAKDFDSLDDLKNYITALEQLKDKINTAIDETILELIKQHKENTSGGRK